MREEDFTHFLGPLPEPYLLVSSDGTLVAINTAAARALHLDAGAAVGSDLARLAPGEEASVREYLRACAHSAAFLPGALTLAHDGVERRVRCEGCALPTLPDRDAPAAVLLRVKHLDAAADRIAQLDRRIRELTEEVRARAEAEAALREGRRRAVLLAEASRSLAISLDYERTLANVARLGVPELADWCAVDLLTESGALRRVAVEPSDRASAAAAPLIGEPYRADGDVPRRLHAVLRTGRAELIQESAPRGGAASPPVPRGPSIIVAPLLADERMLGVLTLVLFESERRHAPVDLVLAEEMAARAGVALAHAALFRAEREARMEAERANRAKSDLLAAIGHEFRARLDAILETADLLDAATSWPIDEEQRVRLERMRDSAPHLRAQIDQVLSLARIEAGREAPVARVVDVAEVTRQVAAVVEPLAVGYGVRLDTRLPHEPLVAVSDPGRVRQLLLSLLGSAIEFAGEGGVCLDLVVRGEMLVWEVHDAGTGIPPEEQERIFEPVTRSERSGPRRAAGTALGLPVSRRLARILGGDVTVESRTGAGSTLSLRLPFERPV